MGPVSTINENLKLLQSLHPHMPQAIQKAIAYGKTLAFDSLNEDQIVFSAEVEDDIFISATLIVSDEKEQELLVSQSKTLSIQSFKEFATFYLHFSQSNTVIAYDLRNNKKIIY